MHDILKVENYKKLIISSPDGSLYIKELMNKTLLHA